jgi:predicted enzyme related to lactoylglutathione lyase
MSSMTPMFSGGRNIAMKVPPHQWETTVAFYRDVLGWLEITTDDPAAAARASRRGSCGHRHPHR